MTVKPTRQQVVEALNTPPVGPGKRLFTTEEAADILVKAGLVEEPRESRENGAIHWIKPRADGPWVLAKWRAKFQSWLTLEEGEIVSDPCSVKPARILPPSEE